MNQFLVIISVIVLAIIVVLVIIYMPKNSGTASVLNSVQNSSSSSQTQSQTSANFEIQGMKVEVLQNGTGDGAKTGDKITVNYVGTLADGTKFDSSIDRGQPFTFTLGQNNVIRGWELGVLGMKAGEKRKLTIPPELAYGSAGAGGVIPPNATITFEIDMLSINQ